MEVILLEKIRRLGNLGDKVRVRAGYGRNYLIPQSKAVRATEANLASFESRRVDLEKKAQDSFQQAEARAQKVVSALIKVAALVGEEGKLFGSVGPREIAEAFTAAGIELHRSEVDLPNGAIRLVGTHAVNVRLHSDVIVSVNVDVVSAA